MSSCSYSDTIKKTMTKFPIDDKPRHIVPKCEEPVDILYQDDYFLIIHKPAFLLSVPGKHSVNKDSVITRLKPRFPGIEAVHRLDLDTSGIMVYPLQRFVLSEISKQFQNRRVNKAYEAIVWGIVEANQGFIELPIAVDWENRPKQQICYETGKPSKTEFVVLERQPEQNQTRLHLIPHTGRTHQLRIHNAEVGHPIIGCDMYAHEQALAASPRLLLHSKMIGFHHPKTGEYVEFYSPAPF